jgi:hypothetical protein
MERTFTIPKTIADVTVEQYVQFNTAKTDLARAAFATGKKTKDIEGLTFHAIDTIVNLFEEVCDQTTAKHEQTFTVGAMRLGFIPDLNSMTMREHVDLEMLSQAVWTKDNGINFKELPRLLAVLFRPVKRKLGIHYELQPYDAGKTNEYMYFINQMTVDRVNGALVFFSSIVKELHNSSQAYLLQQMKKKMEETLELQLD